MKYIICYFLGMMMTLFESVFWVIFWEKSKYTFYMLTTFTLIITILPIIIFYSELIKPNNKKKK